MKKIISLILCVAILIPGAALAETDSSATPFTDVKVESPFYVAITYLKEKNLVQGYEDGTFRPYQEVTRAEALIMILRALRPKALLSSSALTTEPPVSEKPFDDVSEKDWFYTAVKEAKRLQIVNGEDNGENFKPASPVNLAQALRMMYQSNRTPTKFVHFNENPLPPGISADAWFAKDIAYSTSHGIIMQTEEGNVFPPDANLDRGGLALLLYRLLGNRKNKDFGYASWYGDGLSVIRPDDNIEYVDNHLTAAHKTIPMGSLVRVTNMANGKQVDIVINDRGPFVTGRIIDLSRSAFNAIGDSGVGIISVQMETVMLPSK